MTVKSRLGSFWRRYTKRRLSERLVYAFVFLLFAAFALSYLYIFYWGIMSGLKTHPEIALKPFALPEKPQFHNYIEVFSTLEVAGFGFFGMVLNSLYFSVLGTLISNMSACMLAYVTSKYRFPCSRWYFAIVTFMLILPIYGSGGSAYKLYYDLGFIDSYSQIVLSVGGMNMLYLYFHAAFSGVSWNYAEAAFIDGANDWYVFFFVMLPQASKVFLALFMIGWSGSWNDYSGALLYLRKLPTLAGGIYMFEQNIIRHGRTDLLYAAYMISAIPPLVIFIAFNGLLTKNVSLGGIKE